MSTRPKEGATNSAAQARMVLAADTGSQGPVSPSALFPKKGSRPSQWPAVPILTRPPTEAAYVSLSPSLGGSCCYSVVDARDGILADQ